MAVHRATSPSLTRMLAPMDKKIIEVRNVLLGAAILSMLLFVTWKLSVAPLYPENDTAACRSKYRNATTLAETTVVDFLPYRDSTTRRRSRCGMIRTTTLDSITI